MNMLISVAEKKQRAFMKAFPMALKGGPDGKGFNLFAIPKSIYEKEYLKVDKFGYIRGNVKSTNYVKITGTLAGQPLKLFVKETHVYKVLDKLTKDPNREGESVESIAVTMRKVRIANECNWRLKPIVERSLAAVGIAA